MATTLGSGIDVVGFLKEQHEQIKRRFAEVRDTHGAERTKAFYSLRRLLAVHETAEEEIVHPAARRSIENGESVVQARLEEEIEAKKLLEQLETIEIDASEFDTLFSQLERSVLAHVQAEERDEFEHLANVLDHRQLQSMRKAAEFAEKIAPARPPSALESPPTNILAGPFAAMMDHARDALADKAPG